MITQITKTCWQCRGTGVSRFSDNHNQCGVCHGSGKVPDNCNPTPNQTPKINDNFRFDDGTIGTITGVFINRDKTPVIEVNSRKFGYSTFAIASIELIRFQELGANVNIWQVIED